MPYQYMRSTTPYSTPGRPHERNNPNSTQARVDTIIIHHWGNPALYADHPHDGAKRIAQGFINSSREVSAHYVVTDGLVIQCVDEGDTAWHAGTWNANIHSIGIECHPRADLSDLRTLLELISNIQKRHGNLYVAPHRFFINTQCPGHWMNHLDTIRKAANPGGDPVLPIAIQPSPGTSTTVTIDGYWGAATTRAVQRLLGLTADGIISSQDIYWQSRNPGLTTGWEWVGSSSAIGSRTIQALQRLCGLAADGLIGPNTIKALQRRMGTPIDGKIDEQSSFIMALQSRLNRGTI